MLDEREILNIIGEELKQSSGGNENDFIDGNRKAALATYLGQPDGKEVEGKSKVISTDVADAIEWIMPEIMKSFTQNNEVVTFDPCFEGDELQAELESKYVYDILMKDNDGFTILHEAIKDALMQKNGFLKIYYDKDEKITTEAYTGVNEVDLNVILANPNIELLERSDYIDEVSQMPLADIRVRVSNVKSKVKVCCVPPEEFRINKMHDSINVSGARFCAHVMLKSKSELIKEGYDPELVDTLPTYETFENDRDYRFYMQGESVSPNRDINADKSIQHIEISECYSRMDYNEDGVAEYVKVTVAGGDNPTHLLDIEEIDSNPFISFTAILMSHKLYGLSIYDRLKEIQEQKTSLWRNILDNMYLQNNQRTVVVENQVNLDDLMISRPGGIIRVKRPDAIVPFQTPALSPDSYKMMDYLDQVRAGRTGVTPEGPVTDSMIGDRVGSQGIEKMMNQREELVGLMIRVIAETGIKPLCYKIRETVIKHQDTVKDYIFRGHWVKVLPTLWKSRHNTTVRVGTGTGNKKEQQTALTNLMMAQEKILANPSQALVTEEQVFNILHDFAKASGLPGARQYFFDPKSPEGMQHKQQVSQQQDQEKQKSDKLEAAMAEAQVRVANAEEQKAKANMANVQLKNQNDMMKNEITLMEKQHNAEVALLKLRLEEATAVSDSDIDNKDLEFKYWDSEKRHSVELERIASAERIAKEKANGVGSKEN